MSTKIILRVLILLIIRDYIEVTASCPGISTVANPQYLAPININSSKAIYVKNWPPLTIENGLIDLLLVKNTGNALEIFGQPYAITTSSVAGGPLCGVYKFHLVRFYFSRNPAERVYHEIDGVSTQIEVIIAYYSSKYATFKEALKHPNGVVLLTFPFYLLPIPNLLYVLLEPFVDLLKFPGIGFYAPSSLLYGFLDRIPVINEYYYYEGSYQDLETGKEYPGVTVIVTARKHYFIGFGQFASSFMELKNSKGKPLTTKSPIFPTNGRPIYKSFGYDQLIALI